MGPAMMGTGEASGEQRAIVAAEEAIVNPLLDDVTLKGAKSLLLSITGGHDLTLWEVDEAANRVRQEVDQDANIIVGATFDLSLGDRVRVSIVASGLARTAHSGRGADVPASTRAAKPAASMFDDYTRRLTEAIGGNGEASANGDAGSQNPISTSRRKNGVDPDTNRGGVRTPPADPTSQAKQRNGGGYWGHGGDGKAHTSRPESPTTDPQADESPRKTSLLRRLAGAARGRRDNVVNPDPALRDRGTRAEPTGGPEHVDLPVFFGRAKR